jgi:hypothetical protein
MALLIALGGTSGAFGQSILPIGGFCDQGGVSAATSGLNSTNKLQGIIPSCTVTVYLTGTQTLATLYANAAGDPLSNPFTATALGGSLPGQYIFWASTSSCYDVVGSGGISPNAYPAPVPLKTGACIGSGGGGSTGVTSLQAIGNPALTGAVIIACGSGLQCTQSGQTITIGTGTVFTITSFTGGKTVELGTSVVNPTFAATYSTTPGSAQITNTEGIGSPLTLASPFTSGTVLGTFVHTAIETTTFTLTATQGTTQTATQQIIWQPAIFGGVGTAGATSSVYASGTTAVLSTGDALARLQFGAETVGETLGSYKPSGQVVYLFLTGGSHTFTDACTGFPFAFNAPIPVSYVNAQGTTVPMYLYASTNPLYWISGCAYTPKVAS